MSLVLMPITVSVVSYNTWKIHHVILRYHHTKPHKRGWERTWMNTSLAAKPGYISTPSSSAFIPNQRTNWLKLQKQGSIHMNNLMDFGKWGVFLLVSVHLLVFLIEKKAAQSRPLGLRGVKKIQKKSLIKIQKPPSPKSNKNTKCYIPWADINFWYFKNYKIKYGTWNVMSNLNNTPRPVRKLKYTIRISVIHERITSEKELPVVIKKLWFFATGGYHFL